eukprot:g32903.t1
MVFTAWKFQQECQEQHQPLYVAFIDLTKASDTVNREMLWKTLSKADCPMKFINILRLLHNIMSVMVLTDGHVKFWSIPPLMEANEEIFPNMEHLPYLGSDLLPKSSLDVKIQHRIQL